jgi:hypothetical protein
MNNFFDLTDFLGKEKGKKAFVCGMGPSLKKYLDQIKNSNNVKIACSDVDLMTDIIPDYWVFANSIDGAATRMNERWKKVKNTVIVHAYSVDPTPNSWIRQNVTNNYIGYDQRHFNDSSCQSCPGGCNNRIPGKKTIQELLMEISKLEKKYGTGHTVAVHCLALAILLGCEEIYLFGIDLNYSLGYVDNKTVNNDSFSSWLPEILEDFKIMNECAKKLNIKIYNMSEVSPLKDIFETKTSLEF